MPGIIGTTVSGTFLYLIALLNLVVLVSIVKVFRQMRQAATATRNWNDSPTAAA